MTMRILLASDGIEEAGGVDTYLASVACGLVARGHAIGELARVRVTNVMAHSLGADLVSSFAPAAVAI